MLLTTMDPSLLNQHKDGNIYGITAIQVDAPFSHRTNNFLKMEDEKQQHNLKQIQEKHSTKTVNYIQRNNNFISERSGLQTFSKGKTGRPPSHENK